MDANVDKPHFEAWHGPDQGAVAAACIVPAIPAIMVYWVAYWCFGPWFILLTICVFQVLAFLCLLVGLWAWSWTSAPGLTKGATLMGVLGTVLLGLIACWVCESREASRRHGCMNNLRELGVNIGENRQFHWGDPLRQRHAPNARQGLLRKPRDGREAPSFVEAIPPSRQATGPHAQNE
jgi:hypothetical protein